MFTRYNGPGYACAGVDLATQDGARVEPNVMPWVVADEAHYELAHGDFPIPFRLRWERFAGISGLPFDEIDLDQLIALVSEEARGTAAE